MSKPKKPPSTQQVSTALDTLGRDVAEMDEGEDKKTAVDALKDLWIVFLKYKTGQAE